MKLEGTKHTPEVVINEEGLDIEIKGVSMPENAFDFYVPIIEKVEASLKSAQTVNVTMEITYLNSMSNKQLLKLLKVIESSNADKKVVWRSKEDDRLIKMKGMEMKVLCPGLNIELETY